MNIQQKQIHFILRFGSLLSSFSFLIIIWIIFAQVDVVSQAIGQISPDSKIKIINVLHTSIVKNITVKEGQKVKKGQILAELDNVEANTEQEHAVSQNSLDELSLMRIDAQISDNKNRLEGKGYNTQEVAQINAELMSKKASYESQLAQNEAQFMQIKSEESALQAQLIQMKNSTSFWEQQMQSYVSLKEKGFISDMAAQEKITQAQEKLKDMEIQSIKIVSAQAKILENQKNKEKIKTQYKESLYAERNQVVARLLQNKSNIIKSKHQIILNQLVSPVDGIIKEITVASSQMIAQTINELKGHVTILFITHLEHNNIKADAIFNMKLSSV